MWSRFRRILVLCMLLVCGGWSHPGCNFEGPSEEESEQIQTAILYESLARTSPIFCTQCIEVSTYVTVFNDGVSGGTNVDAKTVQTQIDILNERFNSTPFLFNLRRSRFVTNETLYKRFDDYEEEIGERYRQGGLADLNVYYGGVNGGSVAYFPPVLAEGDQFNDADGVFVAIDTILGGTSVCCNLGLTLVHEVGHWLGLHHTFYSSEAFRGDECNPNNPQDFVDDTPLQASATDFECPVSRDSCPDALGEDPIHNYMDYSSDECYTEFTAGQIRRMWYIWSLYRANADACPNEWILFQLNLTTDSTSDPQTHWRLSSSDGSVFWGSDQPDSGLDDFTYDNDSLFLQDICIPMQKDYNFTIVDVDGLDEFGEYSIYLAGDLIRQSSGNFTGSESTLFNTSFATPAPTSPAPSSSKSPSFSSMPSQSPSMSSSPSVNATLGPDDSPAASPVEVDGVPSVSPQPSVSQQPSGEDDASPASPAAEIPPELAPSTVPSLSTAPTVSGSPSSGPSFSDSSPVVIVGPSADTVPSSLPSVTSESVTAASSFPSSGGSGNEPSIEPSNIPSAIDVVLSSEPSGLPSAKGDTGSPSLEPSVPSQSSQSPASNIEPSLSSFPSLSPSLSSNPSDEGIGPVLGSVPSLSPEPSFLPSTQPSLVEQSESTSPSFRPSQGPLSSAQPSRSLPPTTNQELPPLTTAPSVDPQAPGTTEPTATPVEAVVSTFPSSTPTSDGVLPSGSSMPSVSSSFSNSTTNSTSNTTQPSTTGARGPGICDDFLLETFSIGPDRAAGDCVWLQGSSQDTIAKHCQPGMEAYDVCEETCGKCVDNCSDVANGAFLYTSSIVPQMRTCSWLRERPNIRRSLCVETHDAFELCQETCNSCPSELGKIEDLSVEDTFLQKLSESGRTFENRFEDDQASTEDLLWQRMRGDEEELLDDRETRSREYRQNVFDRADATLELDTFLDNIGTLFPGGIRDGGEEEEEEDDDDDGG